jgi:hypothetical protein
MKDVPPFLDFEASSLARHSYPIEVAWNSADGTVESHLISPKEIPYWTDWNAQAQVIHGITKEELFEHGKSPRWICQRMKEALAGKVVYSDNPEYESMWLKTLFAAADAGKKNQPQFNIKNLDELLIRTVCPGGVRQAKCLFKIELLKREAREIVRGVHRAGWDVEYLVELWRLALNSRC